VSQLRAGRCDRDDRAEHSGERGEPYPSFAQPDVGGQLCFRGVQPADDLLSALGEEPAGLGQPHAAAGPLQQLCSGLGLQPGNIDG
jgi:hypothetical protein